MTSRNTPKPMDNLHQIREVSTLSFNERVLQEAEDTRNPLLERLKFLGIFSSNMDEFFKVRVSSIQRRIEIGQKGADKLLEEVSSKTCELDERFQAAYASIMEGLASHGIKLLTDKNMDDDPEVLSWLSTFFHEEILPSLVPIIIDDKRPFPQITDGALYFAVKMWGNPIRHAVLEIPASLPRFVQLPDKNIMYIDDVIRHFLPDIFYIFNYTKIAAFEFKISRDAELDIDNDFSEGYVRKMERVLKQRKGGRPTRLVFDADMPKGVRQMLSKKLEMDADDPMVGGGRYHNMKDLMGFPARHKNLLFEEMDSAPHPVLDRQNRTAMLDTIAKRDLLITYPYQSFDHLICLIREAAIDPAVDEIKFTVYRAARTSKVVNALVNAAHNGKKVFVNIELQARFDEANNIRIAERLTEAGCKVVYGVPPMKVHSKLLLIRKGKNYVAGLSTGNFHEKTAKLYVDSLLFTANKKLTREVDAVFGVLENAAQMRTMPAPIFKYLLVSPFNSKRDFLKLVAREKAKGSEGYILLKVNHLTDDKVVKKLIEAADAGVRMDHIVRTTYAMHPHPNIRAISILDRFLEHQRIYLFGKGPDRVVYMSSADLMERNLDWRIEVAFPILDPTLQQEVVEMMELQKSDSYKARILDATQSNPYVDPERGTEGLRVQYATEDYFHRLYERYEPSMAKKDQKG